MSQEHCIPSSEYQHISYTSDSKDHAEPSFYFAPAVTTQISHPASFHYDTSPYSHPHFTQQSSPLLTGSSAKLQDPPMLVASSSSTTTASTLTSSSVEFLNETFAKAMSLPESFYPEFLQYSRDSYEQSFDKKQNKWDDDSESDKISLSDTKSLKSKVSSSELRRQIHIQSEQKRRAQIKDGFEELRSELPTCLNKKMSKVALLHKTVQHIKHLKVTQASILSELERLVHENEQLRKFQQSILQKQALENMYTVL